MVFQKYVGLGSAKQMSMLEKFSDGVLLTGNRQVIIKL
jgi:hypothetical protein